MTKRRPSKSASSSSTLASCPCGLGDSYDACCGRFHSAAAAAPTAERLMRSRYSAFVVLDAGYLLRTWHPSTRPGGVDFDPVQRWTGLEILSTRDGGLFASTGTVEFRAQYEYRGIAGSQHELSNFGRDGGLWVYLDGAH